MTKTQAVHPWPELIDDLRRFVRGRVNDPDVAEDLVQDTLTKLTARLGDNPPAGPVHAWVLRVARNAIIDHYRSRAKTPRTADDVEVAESPPQHADREPLLASFRSFIQTLPQQQREAVLLVEYEGVSQTELAQRLGVPVSTVKSRVQRARRRLRAALEDCCTFEFDRRGRIIDWQPGGGSGCRDC